MSPLSTVQWVRIRSWHALSTFTRSGGALTRCGRRVGDMDNRATVVDVLPGSRSCESCLRILARQQDT